MLDAKMLEILEEWDEEVGDSRGFAYHSLSFVGCELRLRVIVYHPDKTMYRIGLLLSRAFARIMFTSLRGGHRVATRRMEAYYRRVLLGSGHFELSLS